jgi:hypothetical protein
MIRNVQRRSDVLRRGAVEETREADGHRDTGAPESQVLELQRHSGNAAVARLLQRAPHDGPASTDAPGATASAPGPAPKKVTEDIHARVIAYSVDEGRGKITIGSGPDQGVQVGMTGTLLNGSKEVADFTIEEAKGRVSWAHVQSTQDQMGTDANVIIKASSAPPSMEGKEF